MKAKHIIIPNWHLIGEEHKERIKDLFFELNVEYDVIETSWEANF